MRPSRALVALVAGLSLGAGVPPDVPPTRTRPLLAWLQARTYRATYVGEPGVHASATAHGMHVRTWYAPALAEDLRAGRVPFGRGAAMVKELYFAGTEEVLGWSVMRKLRRRSAGGRGWFFFETLDGVRPIARGRGAPVCVGCHRAGTDFLLSPFRP
jgi:hypothetical protein